MIVGIGATEVVGVADLIMSGWTIILTTLDAGEGIQSQETIRSQRETEQLPRCV
jgi:hypothetical protein